MPFPLIFTGPASAADYFDEIDQFVRAALGDEAASRYSIVIDDPEAVAREMKKGLKAVRDYRVETKDAFYFNWMLKIDPEFQSPFEPTHEAVSALPVSRDLPRHELAANLRRVFSAIVAGTVKTNGIRRIREHGPFEIRGDSVLMDKLDRLLDRFVRQHRMKLPGGKPYEPCYRVIK
jgi:hypothetical protein